MSSIMIRSARVILVMVRATEPSAPARPTAAVSDSRVNQATRRPASIAAWGGSRRSLPDLSCRWFSWAPVAAASVRAASWNA